MNLNNGSVSFNMGAKQLLQQYTKEKKETNRQRKLHLHDKNPEFSL